MTGERIAGRVLASGSAAGRLCVVPGGCLESGAAEHGQAGEPDEEVDRFNRHAAELVRELWRSVERLEQEARSTEAEIIRAHVSILEDEEFGRRVHEAIHREELAAEKAVNAVIEEFAELLRASGDPVFEERVPDLRDLAMQLCRRLRGEDRGILAAEAAEGTIIALPELLPSLVVEAHRSGVRGFVVERGTALSHAAILARSFGLPVLRITSLATVEGRSGERVLVDAEKGRLVFSPERETVPPRPTSATEPRADAGAEMPVRLWLNVMLPEELEGVDWAGVAGIGLFRTEVLFLERHDDFPTEGEQRAAYRRLLEAAGRRPVTVRTLDVGGDKPLGHMSYGPEENPQLGLRAHRLYRFHPELLRTQVRALLAAAADWDGRLRLMCPLVNTMDDWRRLSELTDAAVVSLRTETRDFHEDFSRGFLAETPAAVLGFTRLIAAADFAGVGTNDLVQYLLAVDRSNANVADLYQPEHPVVLGVLRDMVAAAGEAGKPLTICGEIASEHYLLPVLIGLGLTDLSVAVPALDEVRRSLAPLDVEECRSLAGECLHADGVEQVRGLLDDWHGSACLRERARDGEVNDPVCGMAVDPESTPYSLEHQGQRYFFCRRRCMETFRRRMHNG